MHFVRSFDKSEKVRLSKEYYRIQFPYISFIVFHDIHVNMFADMDGNMY